MFLKSDNRCIVNSVEFLSEIIRSSTISYESVELCCIAGILSNSWNTEGQSSWKRPGGFLH